MKKSVATQGAEEGRGLQSQGVDVTSNAHAKWTKLGRIPAMFPVPSTRDEMIALFQSKLSPFLEGKQSQCEQEGAEGGRGSDNGMKGMGFKETQEFLLCTKAYATIHKLYRYKGRFYISEEVWWADKLERSIPFFDQEGDSEGEKFEEIPETDIRSWVEYHFGDDENPFENEIKELDQKSKPS